MNMISDRAARGFCCALLVGLAGLGWPNPGAAQVTDCVQSAFAAALGVEDPILFECDGTILITETIMIEEDVTIDGTSHDITFASPGGTNGVRLFTVAEGVTLTLINVKLVDGLATNGGAIYVSLEGTLNASRCFFSNNAALGVNGLIGTSVSSNSLAQAGKDGHNGQAGGPAAGGAIYNLGVATFTECRFVTNTVAGGGGGDGGSGGAGTFTGGDGGTGGRGGSALGGGIYNEGELYATNCTFHEGRAVGGFGGFGGQGGSAPFSGRNGRGGPGGPSSGAGVFTSKLGVAVIVNSTFSYNGAASGDSSDAENGGSTGKRGPNGADSSGGAVSSYGTNVLINCSFFANVAVGGTGGQGGAATFQGGKGGQGGTAWGGSVFNGGKKARFYATNCTFSDGGAIGGTNGPGGSGPFPGVAGKRGPARGGNLANSNGLFYLHNSLVAYANPGTNAYGKFRDSGYNLSSDRSIKFLRTSGSLAGINPFMDVLKDNGGPVETLELLSVSPAIDRGDPDVCLPADARGVARPLGARCDIGAYEAGQRLLAPEIAIPPADQVAQVGGSVTFRVVATGDPPLTYQWQFAGNDIDDATNTSHMVSNIALNDEGNYTVVVANNSGSVTSAAGVLTVVEPPSITLDPEDISVESGESFTLTVMADGDVPLRYRWLTNGVPIPGATLDHYTVASASARDEGTYQVEVCNDVACVTSAAAQVTVNLATPVILVGPIDQVVAQGGTATFSVQVSGAPAPSFFWRRGATTVFVDLNPTRSSSFVINNAQTANEGSYQVVISNALGMVTSAFATLTVQTVGPSITVQPAGATLDEGTNYTLSVTAAGSTPLTYQWYRNNLPLVGATSSNLVFAPVSATDAASYQVVVGNTLGSLASSAAVLDVVLIPPTITQDLTDVSAATGDAVTFRPIVAGSFLAYRWFFNETNAIAGATNAALTLANLQLSNSGTYRVTITNVAGAATSAPASLTVTVSAPIITLSPDDVTADRLASATFSAAAIGSKPFFYQWVFNDVPLFSPTNATFTLTNPASGSLLRVTNSISGSTLTVTGLQFGDEGAYYLRVINAVGTSDSNPGGLDVNGN